MATSLLKNYKMMRSIRTNYGELRKCEFHIHTPASHDYRLIFDKNYKILDVEEIVHFANEIGYYNDEQRELMLDNISAGKFQGIEMRTYFNGKGYTSFKEYLAYQLIAHQLYINDVEIAVISDHNTIAGYKKLKSALEIYYAERIKTPQQKRNEVKLLLGIEISCSEKIHLVGIFDDKSYDSVNSLIKNYIPSQELGTYETSLSMIEKINQLGGTAYIAHINTTDLKNTTGLYKQMLFSNKSLNVIGLTVNEKKKQLQVLQSHGALNPSDKFCFIYEGDSHQVDEIGKKNTWIKMSKPGFSSLKKAFYNHKICVFLEKPIITDKYIKGMLIEPGEKGYLKGKNIESSFVVDFSSDLNCIIGGRGTGKSTILNILEVIFTLESNNYSNLKFICKNEYIIVNFVYSTKEYLLKFLPQVKKNSGYYEEIQFEDKAFKSVNHQNNHFKLETHWVELYEIQKEETKIQFIEIRDSYEKKTILENVYRKSYSINNIINQINEQKIGDFIKEVVFYGLPFLEKHELLKKLKKLPSKSTRVFLSKELLYVNEVLSRRREEVNNKLKQFNDVYSKQFKVVYSPKTQTDKFYINILFYPLRNKQIKYNISWDNIERFTLSICDKIGFLNFLILLVNNQYKKIEAYGSIINFANNKHENIKLINQGIETINSQNLIKFYNNLRDNLLSDKRNLSLCLENYLEAVDDFSLLFNINLKENVKQTAAVMKDISELSLGQKVVTILTFIFEYGDFFNDNTPLIIDQPEDNLDNQYIYKNLVRSLKQIKNSRQIIIVTHSSTIVTNADAEQVIVLESDNRNGWVEKSGYPDNNTITKHIINYLEGGASSFQHKIGMYSKVLHLPS